MLPRPRLVRQIQNRLARNPAVALLGPRQCGKTTLARMIMAESPQAVRFDLEDPRDLLRLENPMLALEGAAGLVVVDEVQRKPELFQALRVLLDRPDSRSQMLLLGSASPAVVRGVSETLAGRVAFVDMSGFDLTEVGIAEWKSLWQRGGFPRSFLAPDDASSLHWREDFVRTFLERDLPQLGMSFAPLTMRRFWTMLAHYHGQVLNTADLARSLSISESSIRRYLDLLTGSYVVRQLLPWHENLKKRQVKSPKIYVRDTGLLHTLLSIENEHQLQAHPKLGASWEGFVLEQLFTLRIVREGYFWATHAGAELDVLTFEGGRRVGFEIKYADVPRTTRSMRTAISDLRLDELIIVHPGTQSFPLDERISVLGVTELGSLITASTTPLPIT